MCKVQTQMPFCLALMVRIAYAIGTLGFNLRLASLPDSFKLSRVDFKTGIMCNN